MSGGKMTQAERLLKALTEGPIDPLQAWSELGIYRLGARIFDLRQQGHVIRRNSKDVLNRFGERCIVAEYELVRE